MSLFWLRAATALYAVGLLYVLEHLFFRTARLQKAALSAFSAATLLAFVSIVEQSVAAGSLAAQSVRQTVTLLALFLAIAFLVVLWIYDFASLSLIAFPLVFSLALAGAAGSPFDAWPHGLRDAWLLGHVLMNIGGFTATLFMALASLFYLLHERSLKSKEPGRLFQRLPPLRSLDELSSRAMIAGFVLTSAGLFTGFGWAYFESGSRWIGEAKVHISLFTWLFYLAVVYLRTSAGWRGRRAAFLAFYVLLFSTLTWISHSGLRPLLER